MKGHSLCRILMTPSEFTSRVPATGHVNGRFLHTAVNYEDFMFVFAGINAEEKPINDFTCFHFGNNLMFFTTCRL